MTNATVSFDDQFSATVGQFFSQIEIGQAWLTTTLIAAAVTVLCFAVRNQTALVFVTVLALLALLPMAQQGHSAGAEGHDAAITALGLHLVFAAVWLGGLLTVILLHKQLSSARLREVIGRYSTLALVSFVVVAASGYVSAELRIGSWDNLLTGYGILVLAKVALLLVLGGFGVLQRRYLIGRMQSGAGRTRLLLLVARGRRDRVHGPGQRRGRRPRPHGHPGGPGGHHGDPHRHPGADPHRRAAAARARPSPGTSPSGTSTSPGCCSAPSASSSTSPACGGCAAAATAGRCTAPSCGSSGMITLFYITNGGVNVYEKYLFSTHMLAHMALTMLVPVLLVPGAPVTLAARAIRMRRDGSRGPREWILLAVHSKFAGVISNPLVAAVLFAGSLWVFYYTPLFSWATTDHIGHQWMIVHFLITGYLFVQSLIGIDPVPYRLPYTFRLLLLLGTMAFHAFFGLALMTGTGLLLADWYGAMGRDWGLSALADQQAGGGIAWSVGEIPTIALAIIVAIQWGRSDEKETKRRDRNADRTGEAELNEYNERLARLAAHDR